MQHPFFLTLLVLLSGIAGDAFGTHQLATSLYYTHLTGNQYLVSARLYRDCSGVPSADSFEVCMASALMGYAATIKLPKINSTYLSSFPQLPALVPSCMGGTGFGVEKIFYSDTVTFPFPATDWILSHRTEGVTTVPYPEVVDELVYTTLDMVNAPGNSSPAFLDDPRFFYCVGFTGWCNYQATEPDGDTLRYSLLPAILDSVDCPHQPFSNSIYINTNPLLTTTGHFMDSLSGMYQTTPALISFGLLTIKVTESRNGITISETVQSVENFSILNCLATAVSTIQPTASVSIYPIPASAAIQVSFNEPTAFVSCSVWDITGKKLSEQPILSGQQSCEIDISGLKSGVYFLRMLQENGISEFSKFLKQD